MLTTDSNSEELARLRARVAELELQLASREQSSSAAALPGVQSPGIDQHHRRLLETILDHMPVGVFVVEVPSGRPVLVNEFSRHLLRKPDIPDVPKELIAQEYYAYVAGTNQPYPMERMPIVRAMTGECASIDDLELRFPDGTITPIQIFGAPIYDATGEITMSIAITQDITARKLAEEKLRAEREFLRVLIKAHERERQLMAYEIHDGLVQYITAALWHLESAAERAQFDAESRHNVDKTQQLLRQALAEGRRVLSGLRPPVLDEQGIVVALDYLAAENALPGKLDIEVDLDVHFRRLEPLLEGAIFRIVQESLSNVRKHSRAKKAHVRLAECGDRLLLTIEDHGCGFCTSTVPRDRFGLQGISKRAELLGGSAKFESAPGKGTKVIVDLPLIAADEG